MRYVLALLGLLFCGHAYAQDALVVSACGTLPLAYTSGATRLLTVDVNGKMCNSGGGGSGSPGGTSGQVQYNNAGSFGGFTFSGDLTLVPSTGVSTLKNTGPGATGPIGSTTTTPVVTIDAQGRVTALTSATIAGAVASVTGGVGVTVSPTTGAVVVSAPVTQRNNTATTDTLVTGDAGTTVTESNASPVAVAIAQAGTTGFASGQYWTLKNKGAGLVTLTPTTSTIDGAATFALSQNQSVDFYSDGTNYITLRGPSTTTIASGSTAMGTGAISSAACASTVTATATGVLTTDTITASFNGDPTAVTGYIPATAGMLTIFIYPTANTFNAKVCNNTSSSITPGAVTLNWRVVR